MRLMKYVAACASLCLITAMLHAENGYVRWYRGSCYPQTVGEWIVVITYNDAGRPVHICGTRCDGTSWEGHCTVVSLPGDPGYGGYYESVNSDGSWSRVLVTGGGMLQELWGRDAGGEYWGISDLSIS